MSYSDVKMNETDICGRRVPEEVSGRSYHNLRG